MSLSDLCQRCGLCCDGTLFSHVPLQAGEVEPARRNGLDVGVIADGTPVLRQGCTALCERRCTVYTERPEACRRYSCRLFTQVAAGTVSPEDALTVVAEAHALLSQLERGLPPDTEARPSPILERARFAGLSELGAPAPETQALRERLEAHLDAHFHGGPRRFGGT
ncbi:MAG TPA: YkgJ family cysteine cluster protein [Archangium sp.]|nr:YkgJ family cysteine cluster protein [Archangium sp.]